MAAASTLFVGTAGQVYAIDRSNGEEIWTTTLNTNFFKFGTSFVNLEFDGEYLFAASFGELYCLDPATGKTRWKKPLAGILANPITFASTYSNNGAATMAEKLANQ